MNGKIRMAELFSGIGAQATALENLGIPFEAFCCEIDNSAYKAYCAIHGDTPNLGNIMELEHLPEHIDLLTYSFPCQDLSIAGLQKGMTEGSGSRSSLLWEVGRLLEDAKERSDLPKYLVMENVDAILNTKNYANFQKWITKLTEMGYTSSYKVLNATDYGVPQSRRRCFMVSALDEGRFRFPEGRPMDKRLRDVLEADVPEEFYLSEERIAKYERTKSNQAALGRGFGWKPTTLDGIMPTIMTNPNKDCTNTVIEDPELIKAGDLNQDGIIDQHNRVYSAEGISPTVCPPHGNGDAPKIETVGDLHQDGWHRLANEVYGTDGIAPCVHAQANNLKTKIEEPELIRAGTLDLAYDQDSRVYSADGISPTLRVGGPPPSVEETGIIIAGEIPGSNFNGARRVLSVDGVAPTITCEHVGINHPKIEVTGDLHIDGKFESANRVYDTDGIAPTLPAGCGEGGGITPKIEVKVSGVPLADGIEDMVDEPAVLTPKRTQYGKDIRKDYEAGKVDETRHNMVEFVPRDDGVSNTLTTVARDNILVEKEEIPLMEEGDVAAMHTPGRAEKRQNGPRFKNDGTSFTLTTQDIDGIAKVEQGKLRIRYLTPRECWRLQVFDDARIDKAFEVITAKTVRYRLAGNSIAVPCLEAIFKGIFIDKVFDKKQKSILEW